MLRLLHVITEHNNLVVCLGSLRHCYPACYLLPYPYIVVPLGQGYLFRCAQQLE